VALAPPLYFSNLQQRSHDLGVFTGVLKNHDVDLVKIVDHIFVGDTIDGGATVWLRKPNADGRRVPRFKERSNTEQYSCDWPASSTLTGYEKQTEEKYIPLRCHCKGVDFLQALTFVTHVVSSQASIFSTGHSQSWQIYHSPLNFLERPKVSQAQRPSSKLHWMPGIQPLVR
jgi:hypothetical protein